MYDVKSKNDKKEGQGKTVYDGDVYRVKGKMTERRVRVKWSMMVV